VRKPSGEATPPGRSSTHGSARSVHHTPIGSSQFSNQRSSPHHRLGRLGISPSPLGVPHPFRTRRRRHATGFGWDGCEKPLSTTSSILRRDRLLHAFACPALYTGVDVSVEKMKNPCTQ